MPSLTDRSKPAPGPEEKISELDRGLYSAMDRLDSESLEHAHIFNNQSISIERPWL